MKAGSGMLKGVRVLSLTAGIAGPATSRYLAQAGAEVIKLESSPGGLDNFRFYSTADDIEASGRFMENNLNVLTAQLNLKSDGGKRLFLELVEKSDVVLENFRPGVFPRLGLGIETLRKANPRIIYLKMPGMGSTGPKSSYGTWGQTLNAMTGMTYLWNHPDQAHPVGFQGAYPDYVAAMFGPTIIMAALLRRRRTGEGTYVELAQAEMLAYVLGVNYAEVLVNGREPEPQGNDWPHAAPHNCYPCAGDDRWCVIAVETDEQWRQLCQTVGPSVLSADDPRFASLSDRRRNRHRLDEIVAAWTRQRDAHEIMHLLQGAGVPCGAVQKGEDIYEDPQLQARRLVHVVAHPGLGDIPVATLPIHFSDSELEPPRAMQVLGADNEHVYCEILGYSRDQLAEWESQGVVR